jgi:hypothetical protein
MKNEQKDIENIQRLMFMPDPKICFKIFEYISLYANNMKINDIVNVTKTNNDLTQNYWLVFIEADQACFRNLQNYLEE